jgi:hypothetical protein
MGVGVLVSPPSVQVVQYSLDVVSVSAVDMTMLFDFLSDITRCSSAAPSGWSSDGV